MIKINLLPPEMAKGKKEKVKMPKAPSSGTPVVVLILIILFAASGGFAYWVISQKMESDRKVKSAQRDRDNLEEQVQEQREEFKELVDLRFLLENKIAVLKALSPEDRLLWSEKLNMLADLIPKGVYLTDIRVTEDIKQVETEASKERRRKWNEGGSQGEEPPMVKKPQITQTLVLSGITWAEDPEQRLQLILRFHDALMNYQTAGQTGRTRRFMDNFQEQIRIDPTWVEQVAGRTVNRFKLILKTKPFSPQESLEQE